MLFVIIFRIFLVHSQWINAWKSIMGAINQDVVVSPQIMLTSITLDQYILNAIKHVTAYVSGNFTKPSLSSWIASFLSNYLKDNDIYSLGGMSVASSARIVNHGAVFMLASIFRSTDCPLFYHCIDYFKIDILYFMNPKWHLWEI